LLVLGAAVALSSSFAGDQVLRWLGVASGALVASIGVLMLRGAARTRRSEDVAPAADLPEPVLAAGVPALAGGRGPAAVIPAHEHGHTHGHTHGHGHGHGHDHHTHGHPHRSGRTGLVGMGVAGGLVPSPSALVVLLASVGLGRTVFGVLLVLAYGLGMAATLTAVGLALVRMRNRLADRLARRASSDVLRRLARTAPLLTAALVIAVGVALVVRGVLLGT
jgi:ABC-type nickel/cobalt efflux system permease component RcnA